MIHAEEVGGQQTFQAYCPECGPVGPVVEDESLADDFEFSHRRVHPDAEVDESV